MGMARPSDHVIAHEHDVVMWHILVEQTLLTAEVQHVHRDSPAVEVGYGAIAVRGGAGEQESLSGLFRNERWVKERLFVA